MDFTYSYWRSGFAIFIIIVISVFMYIFRDAQPDNRAMFTLWLIMSSIPFVLAIFSIFWAKNEKLRDKISKMSKKEERAYKLERIKRKSK